MLYAISNLHIYPQSVTFEHLTVEDGLAHNSGLCFVQDNNGFLWIGTQNGLSRYDGYNFINYTHQPGDSTSLSDSYINSLYLDHSGSLWIGTNQGGLNRFNRYDDSFTSYKNKPGDSLSIGKGAIYSINEDKYNNLWLGINPSGLFLFDRKTENFYHYEDNHYDPLSIHGKRVYYIFKDSKDHLWVGTDKGLNKMVYIEDSTSVNEFRLKNPNIIKDHFTFQGKFFYFIHWSHENTNSNSLINDKVMVITEDISKDESEYWIGTWGGISRLRFNDDKLSFHNLNFFSGLKLEQKNNRISTIFIDEQKYVWIGMVDNGLIRYDIPNNSYMQFGVSDKTYKSFTGKTVRSIFKDNSGVIYFGTENEGVYKYLSSGKKFSYYKHTAEDPYSISSNNITALFEDSKGRLWIGTKHGGLNRLDRSLESSGRFISYKHESDDPGSILQNHIRGIYEDHFGKIWFGSWSASGGLNQYDPETNKFIHFQHNSDNPGSLSDNQVRAIAEDKSGDLWIGLSETGLDKFDRSKKEFVHYPHNPFDLKSLSDNVVMSIYTDSNGDLWISTYNGGLNKFNPEANDFTHYKFDSSNQFSISHNRVWSVYEDNAGRFWVGTSRGLNLMNRNTGEFIHFAEEDGLGNNTVYGILEDDAGSLWLGTEKGLSKATVVSTDDYYSTKVKFTNYGADDNLSGLEFNAGAFCKSRNGKMFFGSVNGLLEFFPDSIKNNRHIPPVVITSFKVFEKEIALDSAITEKKQINLSYQQNFISLEFAALDFQAPDKNQYAFKLEGATDDWINIGNRRHISFSNLDPGFYKFRVKASNNDGLWNEEGTSLSIIIHPPFWMTAWFRIISSTLILICFILLIRFISTQKLKKKLHEAEIRQKLQEERERISRELHDNIGANLTSIITGLEILKRYSMKDDKKNLIENISSLGDHTRNTIDELRQTIWSLHNEVNEVKELNEKIKEYILHRVKFGNKQKIKFYFDGNGNIKLSSSEALNLFRIVQESINNAIKYSNGSEIKVYVEAEGSMLKIIIRDYGTGFDQSRTEIDSNGLGLINMKKRAAVINAILKIDSVINKGTSIKIELDTAN